jgi:hypothetical protein
MVPHHVLGSPGVPTPAARVPGRPRMPSVLPRRAPDAPAAVLGTRAPVFPPDNGVDALAGLTGLHPGSLHATTCEVAHLRSDALVRELGASGYPGDPQSGSPPSSYPGALPAPGAGLPPASPMASTAYRPVPFSSQEVGEPNSGLAGSFS